MLYSSYYKCILQCKGKSNYIKSVYCTLNTEHYLLHHMREYTIDMSTLLIWPVESMVSVSTSVPGCIVPGCTLAHGYCIYIGAWMYRAEQPVPVASDAHVVLVRTAAITKAVTSSGAGDGFAIT